MIIRHRIYILTVLPIIALWLIDALIDSLLFSGGSFLDDLILHVPSHDIFMRSVGSLLILIFGIIMTQVYFRQKATEQKLNQNVTALNDIGKSLKESERNFRNSLDNSPLGMAISNELEGFLYANKALLSIWGYSSLDELNAVPFEKRYTKESLELFITGKEQKRGIANLHETEAGIITKKGEVRSVILMKRDTLWNGENSGLIIYQDTTERKLAEKEIEHKNNLLLQKTKELEIANIHLQDADRLKSIFLASMSHELRTPLNSILGFTGILLQGLAGELNEEQKQQLSIVKSSSIHLLSLINDVLDLSKLEAGKIELTLEDFSFDALMKEVLDIFTPMINMKGLSLSNSYPQGIKLYSDQRRIKQVLINLLSNAVKFTDKGSISVKAELKDSHLEIRFKDTGTGISKENMNRLFQPFQQVDVDMTKKHEGTGLGLYLSKKLANLMGGDITVTSESGKGSEFVYTIKYQ